MERLVALAFSLLAPPTAAAAATSSSSFSSSSPSAPSGAAAASAASAASSSAAAAGGSARLQQLIEIPYQTLPTWLLNRRLLPPAWRQQLKSMHARVESEARVFAETPLPASAAASSFFAANSDNLHYLAIKQLVLLLERDAAAAAACDRGFALSGFRRGEAALLLRRWKAIQDAFEKNNIHVVDMHRQLCHRLDDVIPASQRSLQNQRKQLQDCSRREKELLRATKEAQRDYTALCNAYSVSALLSQQQQTRQQEDLLHGQQQQQQQSQQQQEGRRQRVQPEKQPQQGQQQQTQEGQLLQPEKPQQQQEEGLQSGEQQQQEKLTHGVGQEKVAGIDSAAAASPLVQQQQHLFGDTEAEEAKLKKCILSHVKSKLPELLQPAETLLRMHGPSMADFYMQFCEYFHVQQQQQHHRVQKQQQQNSSSKKKQQQQSSEKQEQITEKQQQQKTDEEQQQGEAVQADQKSEKQPQQREKMEEAGHRERDMRMAERRPLEVLRVAAAVGNCQQQQFLSFLKEERSSFSPSAALLASWDAGPLPETASGGAAPGEIAAEGGTASAAKQRGPATAAGAAAQGTAATPKDANAKEAEGTVAVAADESDNGSQSMQHFYGIEIQEEGEESDAAAGDEDLLCSGLSVCSAEYVTGPSSSSSNSSDKNSSSSAGGSSSSEQGSGSGDSSSCTERGPAERNSSCSSVSFRGGEVGGGSSSSSACGDVRGGGGAAAAEDSRSTTDDVRLFEHRVLRHLLLQDIDELRAFLYQRLAEKQAAAEREEALLACSSSSSSSSSSFSIEMLQQVDALPPHLAPSVEQLKEWLQVAERLAELVGGRETLQLLLLQSNPKTLRRVLEKFAAARRKISRYASDLQQLHERMAKLHKQMEEERQRLLFVKREARELRGAIESQSPSQLCGVYFHLLGIPSDKIC